MQKSLQFEGVKNFAMAIQYIDSATKVGLKDTSIVSKRIFLEILNFKFFFTKATITVNICQNSGLFNAATNSCSCYPSTYGSLCENCEI